MIDARYVGEELIYILQHADVISESCVIDFKVQPHKKKQNCELYKDILALANEYDRPNQERWLIYGVEDKRHILVGVDAGNPNLLDDSVYHEKLHKIDERVHFEFVRVPAERVIGERGLGKVFAAFYIPKDNAGIIHEISSPVEDDVESETEGSGRRSKNRRYEAGTSFVRIGSATKPMLEEHRIKIREIGQRMRRYPYRGYTELSARRTLPVGVDRLRILGSWDESNVADTRIVAELCGTSYQNAIESIRDEVEFGLFTLRGPIWKVSDRKAALEEVGRSLVPSTLQTLFTIFQKVMGSTDGLYVVPEDQRLMAAVRGVDRGCSPVIREGVAAFCACLSANRSLVPYCTDRVIDDFIDGITRIVLEAESWSLLASNDCALPLLAEASPSLFLSVVDRNTKESSSVTVFLRQKAGDIVSTDLGHGLVRGVSIAAMSGEHLALAIKVLVSLSPYSALAKDAIVRMLLPWMPMTNAPLKNRMGMGTYLASCGTAEAWTALVELLPNKTMNTLDQEPPAFLNVAIPSKEVPLSEYLEASKAYCQAVLEGAEGDADRIVDIASNIACFASIGLTSEMANAVRRYCSNIADRERYAVWSTIQSYVARCERYPHANWAPNEDDSRTIRELLHDVKPCDPYYEALYVCKTESHALVVEGDSVQRHDSALSLRTRAIEVSCGGGVIPLCERLLKDGAKPRLLGEALGCLELGDGDQHWLFSRFEGGESAQTLDELASAYCLVKYAKGRQEWVDSIEFQGWSERKIAGFFASLPCTRELWEKAELLLADQSCIYWSLVQHLCEGESSDEVMHCAERLQSVGRAKAAIEYVYDALASGIEVDSDAILDAVGCISALDNDTMTEYYINELFKYVERVQPSDRLWVLEFQYAGVLESRPDAFLFRQMASSPQAFVEVVRAESGITEDDAPDEPHGAKNRLLVHMYVLGKWVIVPGYDENGVFDASAFERWLGEARAEARTRGFGNLADEEIGRNLFHATPNDEELFMPVPMLSFLDSCDSARDGYYRESFNYRGPHFVDQTGEEEEEIARSFDEKARVCEERGFVSFAITLRRIAAEYRREAKDNRGGEWFARL